MIPRLRHTISIKLLITAILPLYVMAWPCGEDTTCYSMLCKSLCSDDTTSLQPSYAHLVTESNTQRSYRTSDNTWPHINVECIEGMNNSLFDWEHSYVDKSSIVRCAVKLLGPEKKDISKMQQAVDAALIDTCRVRTEGPERCEEGDTGSIWFPISLVLASIVLFGLYYNKYVDVNSPTIHSPSLKDQYALAPLSPIPVQLEAAEVTSVAVGATQTSPPPSTYCPNCTTLTTQIAKESQAVRTVLERMRRKQNEDQQRIEMLEAELRLAKFEIQNLENDSLNVSREWASVVEQEKDSLRAQYQRDSEDLRNVLASSVDTDRQQSKKHLKRLKLLEGKLSDLEFELIKQEEAHGLTLAQKDAAIQQARNENITLLEKNTTLRLELSQAMALKQELASVKLHLSDAIHARDECRQEAKLLKSEFFARTQTDMDSTSLVVSPRDRALSLSKSTRSPSPKPVETSDALKKRMEEDKAKLIELTAEQARCEIRALNAEKKCKELEERIVKILGILEKLAEHDFVNIDSDVVGVAATAVLSNLKVEIQRLQSELGEIMAIFQL